MRVPFSNLPDDARIWIFSASRPLDDAVGARLLSQVDAWLDQWKAHGAALTCAREWRDDRFLVIGVDQSEVGASGCSIDALFRILRDCERESGTSLVAGGRVFYRDRSGDISCTDRDGFRTLALSGMADLRTRVFDSTLTIAREYRTAFERAAGESWHVSLLN
ncbi:MAG: hypothetical protein ACT4OZ_09155 [Gemmatimonadota bacterium]